MDSNNKKIKTPSSEFQLQSYSLSTLVCYASLLTSLSPSRKVFKLNEAHDANTTPSYWLTHKTIVSLADYGLIKLRLSSVATNYKILLVHGNEDVHLKSVLTEIGRRKANYTDKDLLLLTHNCLKASLHTHISKQLLNAGINLTLSEIDFEAFTSTIERRSLAQLCMIVWQAVQNISPSNLRYFSLSKEYAGIVEQVETLFLETLGRYESKNRAIQSFRFSQKSHPSLSLVLFNSVLCFNEDYSLYSLREIWNRLE